MVSCSSLRQRLFGGGSSKTTAPSGSGTGAQPAADRATAAGDRSTPTGVSGVLAGQVIDSFNGKPPVTHIQVVSVEDPKEKGAAPIVVKNDVDADQNGYFTIQGLQPGRQYQLIAKAEDGGHKLLGMTWATPPNPRVTIKISEDFAGAGGADSNPQARNRGSGGQRSSSGEKGKSPPAEIGKPIVPGTTGNVAPSGGLSIPIGGPAPPPDTGAELGSPLRGGAPQQNPAPPTPPAHPESIVDKELARRNGITADMPGAGSRPAPAPSPPAVSTGPAPVPSCQLVGRRLYNFALKDVAGQPWEFRKDRKGRLVLLDFWGTWCVYCVQGIPHLKVLQENYGPWGLEVISIAYEQGPSAEHARKVAALASRMNTNYRLLLGGGYEVECPVRRQFEVSSYPAYFLIDEHGQIVWQCRQALGERELKELEFEIKRRLGVR
jgi:thiol-disulfide isomerase/thioredoxin